MARLLFILRVVGLTLPKHPNSVGFSRGSLDGWLCAAPCLWVLPVDATSKTLRSAFSISVNGEPREMPAGASLADLVAALGLTGRRIAIALNRDVVPRTIYGARFLHADDRVEILEAVGGG